MELSDDFSSAPISRDNVVDFSPLTPDLWGNNTPRDLVEGRREPDHSDWASVIDILDEAAPGWSHRVRSINAIGEFITMTVAITVGGVSREGVGIGFRSSETGINHAEYEAVKAAAQKFALVGQLRWRKHVEMPEVRGMHSFPSDPVARTRGELVSAKQLAMIRSIAMAAGVNPEKECEIVMQCAPQELTKRGAAALIDHLEELRRKSEAVENTVRKVG